MEYRHGSIKYLKSLNTKEIIKIKIEIKIFIIFLLKISINITKIKAIKVKTTICIISKSFFSKNKKLNKKYFKKII